MPAPDPTPTGDTTVLRVSFELRVSASVLVDELAKARKPSTIDEFMATAVDRLREDLERDVGDGWEPFERSPFEITLSEGAA